MATITEQLPPLFMMGQLLAAVETDAQRLHDAYMTGKRLGAVTGLSQTDDAIGKALQPGVHVLHGAPGTGKSAFAWQVAGRCQCPALFVSCEMSPLEMFKRQIARETGEFLGKLKSGELPPDKVHSLAVRAAGTTPSLVLMDATVRKAEVTHIYEIVQLQRERMQSNHFLLVIDSLHTWASKVTPDTQEYERLTFACDVLCELAQKLGCAVLVVSERPKGKADDGGISSGAGSRRIEYSAETVFGLDIDKKKEKIGGVTPLILTIAKNRNGAAGRAINLLFDGALQKFTEAPF